MNSETVSNLVTTGVGSEAAPVEVDEPSSKRLRPATSDVWNFFKKLGPDKDGVERAECKGCKKVFKAGVWQIQLILMNSLKNDEVLIRNMGEKMMIKFNKYWEEYSVVLAFGAVLDPRFKLNTLVHCYNEIDPISAKDKVELVKSKLYKLFEVYDQNSSTTVESSSQLSSHFSQATSSAIGTQLIKVVGDLMSRNQEAEVKSGKNQLDIYLSEATLFCNDAIIDVLQWWKDNHHRFPTLSLMARDLLSIPITTVASESAFSMGSHVLNKYRSRLLSDNVEAVICTRN
nr:zinc finger BED domain-containing protein RICESLEEPER 2-like isoform X2 [Arachis hypogaea]XP_029143352.1 zinc finger BED domain-containing protein RICESLEEPER 2-like isoform X2 [Arachis hypogaea]